MKRFARFLVYGSAALLMGTSWYLSGQNYRLRKQNAALLAAREYPLIFAGMRLGSLPNVSILRGSAPAPTRRKLILAFDNTCGICERNIPQWQSLLAGAGASLRDIEVWLLTFNGTDLTEPIERKLREEGISYKVLRANDAIALGLMTGIVGVPSTILLDDRDAVDVVATGELSDTSRSMIVARMESSDAANSAPAPRRFAVSRFRAVDRIGSADDGRSPYEGR
jgi:hypothetical protein